VPENNFETMIREFMASHSKKSLAIITTDDDSFLRSMDERLHFSNDDRVKFVGTVYDQDLLKKIRENAYGYIHGHSVGGTNPSLLEALASTKLNLLLNVGFNKEVGRDAALYWNKEPGNLSILIDQADQMKEEDLLTLSDRAKQRIKNEYSWERISKKYLRVFGVN
jgi:rhamnosyltransferase